MEGMKIIRKVVTKVMSPQQAHILPRMFLHTSVNEEEPGCKGWLSFILVKTTDVFTDLFYSTQGVNNFQLMGVKS